MSLAGVMSDEEEDDMMQPFERQVENENKQKKAGAAKPKKTTQTKLPFQKKPAADDEDDEDDDDDDDDDLKGFDFKQHKPAAPAAAPKISSLREDEPDAKKKKKPAEERTLLKTRWVRGWKPLPEGWTARSYCVGKGGKEFWVFSHPYWGETKELKDLQRTDEQWGEVLAKKHRLSKPSARESFGSSADGEVEAEEAGEDDGLAALLSGKRKRDEADEATRQEVHEEMSLRMDTGVRVNKALASAMLRN